MNAPLNPFTHYARTPRDAAGVAPRKRPGPLSPDQRRALTPRAAYYEARRMARSGYPLVAIGLLAHHGLTRAEPVVLPQRRRAGVPRA